MTEPTAPLCFIDTETDGIHPDRRPWEIALIRRDENGEHETSFFVDIDLSTADPFALRIGRFYERHPLGKALFTLNPDRWADVATPHLHAALTVARYTHGAHLVGNVPGFDAHVFDRLLREHRLTPAWHYHLIDVEALAIGYLRGQGEPMPPLPWKSDELSIAIGVQPPGEDDRHTALGDARWAMRLYDRITADPEPIYTAARRAQNVA